MHYCAFCGPPKYPLAYFIQKQSVALVQVYRGMNVIIFNRCVVPKGAQYKKRLTDVSWITLLLWTQSNFRSVAGAKEIDIAATLEHLRDQRAGMVQTKVRSPALSWRGGGGGWQAGREEGVSVIQTHDCLLHVPGIRANDAVIDKSFRIRKTLSWMVTHHSTFITQREPRNLLSRKHFLFISMF